jgi:hypothetical protein
MHIYVRPENANDQWLMLLFKEYFRLKLANILTRNATLYRQTVTIRTLKTAQKRFKTLPFLPEKCEKYPKLAIIALAPAQIGDIILYLVADILETSKRCSVIAE